jgi:phosphoribosylformylglycinamidine synthase
VSLPDATQLFHEQAGRAVIETTDPDAVRDAFDGIAPVGELGNADDSGSLSVDVGGTEVSLSAGEIRELRSVIERELD